MADIKKLIPFLLKWEGGFVNDPVDLGGATNKGITIKTFISYRKAINGPPPTIKDLKNIPDEEWTSVLKMFFWDKWKADDIKSQSLANILVDWVWASGVYGIKIPQRMLGVQQDGIVGPKTIEALNKEIPYIFWLSLVEERKDFVDNIVKNNHSQIRFKQGWLNRINDLKFID